MVRCKKSTTPYVLVAAAIGNALDWYDFIVYGYFATVIAGQYFPPGAGWTGVLYAYAVFAISFLIRPLGGVALGYYADVIGRKKLMTLVIALMTTGTAGVCFTPTYASIGIGAPLIIILARCLQGLAAGGEFASTTAFMIEHAPQQSRGLYGGWQLSGQGAAITLAGASITFLHYALTPSQFEDWGWRLPFAVGLLVGPIGAYIRLKAEETPAFLEKSVRGDEQNPLQLALGRYKRQTITGFGLVVGGTATFYVLFIFMPTYALRVLHLTPEASFIAPAAAGLIVTLACPISGALSDRLGRKRMMVVAAAVLTVLVIPSFQWLISEPSFTKLTVVELAYGLLISVYGGPFSAAISELFPTVARATAVSIAYNLGVAVFGGSAPMILTVIITTTSSSLAPAYYVGLCLLLSTIAATALTSTAMEGSEDSKASLLISDP